MTYQAPDYQKPTPESLSTASSSSSFYDSLRVLLPRFVRVIGYYDDANDEEKKERLTKNAVAYLVSSGCIVESHIFVVEWLPYRLGLGLGLG